MSIINTPPIINTSLYYLASLTISCFDYSLSYGDRILSLLCNMDRYSGRSSLVINWEGVVPSPSHPTINNKYLLIHFMPALVIFKRFQSLIFPLLLTRFLFCLSLCITIVPVALISLLVSERALITMSPRLNQLDKASTIFSAAIATVQPMCLVGLQQLLLVLFMRVSRR